MAPPLIYVVDDDPLVRTSVARLLEVETDHRVRTFERGEEALAAMAAEAPDLLVTDLTMPGMGGLELLRRARAVAPRAARIVLTGFADKDSAIHAINEGAIYQYLEKPWDNAQLLATIQHALDAERLTRELAQRNQELERTLAELRDAQDRLIAGERLAAVGRLATGIAHEIGNQLSLLGYAELLAEKFEGDPEVRELTDPLMAARRRLSGMVASIREFVRGQGNAYQREELLLLPIVDEALSILRFEPAIKMRTVVREPRDAEVSAVVNKDKILQVLINLLRNSLQATREGGHLRVGVRREGDQALIEVGDDGIGIAPEHQERIFEPFFTTKGETGTGLGLGICRRIVEEHGGTITVASEPEKGATFTVRLPAV